MKGVGERGEVICLTKSRVDYVALKLKSKRLGFKMCTALTKCIQKRQSAVVKLRVKFGTYNIWEDQRI